MFIFRSRLHSMTISRTFVLLLIIFCVSVAFWYSFHYKLKHLMRFSCVEGANDILTTEQKKRFNTLLLVFKSQYGIESKMRFVDMLPTQYKSVGLEFIVQRDRKNAKVYFAPIVERLFSVKERAMLQQAIASVILREDWEDALYRLIDEIYIYIGELQKEN